MRTRKNCSEGKVRATRRAEGTENEKFQPGVGCFRLREEVQGGGEGSVAMEIRRQEVGSGPAGSL